MLKYVKNKTVSEIMNAIDDNKTIYITISWFNGFCIDKSIKLDMYHISRYWLEPTEDDWGAKQTDDYVSRENCIKFIKEMMQTEYSWSIGQD